MAWNYAFLFPPDATITHKPTGTLGAHSLKPHRKYHKEVGPEGFSHSLGTVSLTSGAFETPASSSQFSPS